MIRVETPLVKAQARLKNTVKNGQVMNKIYSAMYLLCDLANR